VVDAVLEAHACAKAIDRRGAKKDSGENRRKVRKSFAQLANCVRRAPASVRCALDNSIPRLIPHIVDAEVISDILDTTCRLFVESPKNEAAQTALRVLIWPPNADFGSTAEWQGAEQHFVLKTNYLALDPTAHLNCESALATLGRASKSVDALAVFKTLTLAIDISADVSDLIVSYVEAVGKLWRQIGLSPSRATHPVKSKYTSKFHRFVELVLTAAIEPGSNRHCHNLDEIGRQTRAAHARLPSELRPEIGGGLRRADREWLVSET
jgi:hypothetical protein